MNAVGLFDVEGAERAIGRTFRGTDADGGRILERLAEELAEGYGGLARVTLDAGAGHLGPGEARELAVTFHLPDELRPGRAYEGAWTLPTVNYMIRVEVAERQAEPGGGHMSTPTGRATGRGGGRGARRPDGRDDQDG